jgi:hypothetical protein
MMSNEQTWEQALEMARRSSVTCRAICAWSDTVEPGRTQRKRDGSADLMSSLDVLDTVVGELAERFATGPAQREEYMVLYVAVSAVKSFYDALVAETESARMLATTGNPTNTQH